MVRFCIVDGCKQSDTSILAHRFPKNLRSRIKWQEALNLQKYDLDVLVQKYVVCTRHFKKSDYRNSISTSLNSTAIPTLDAMEFDAEQVIEMIEEEEGEVTADEVAEKKVQVINVKSEHNSSGDSSGVRRKRSRYETYQEMLRLKESAANAVDTSNPLKYEDMDFSTVTFANSQAEDSITVIEVTHTEVSTQTDQVKLEEITENMHPDFRELSKQELVELILEKDNKIQALETKVKKFETAMSAFKTLMNPGD